MCRRRPTSGTANPRGGSDPYLSSNNEHILDIKFESVLRLDGKESCSYEDIADAIEGISGVVAHGLVLKDSITAVVHTAEGAQILRKVCATPLPPCETAWPYLLRKWTFLCNPPFTPLLALVHVWVFPVLAHLVGHMLGGQTSWWSVYLVHP